MKFAELLALEGAKSISQLPAALKKFAGGGTAAPNDHEANLVAVVGGRAPVSVVDDVKELFSNIEVNWERVAGSMKVNTGRNYMHALKAALVLSEVAALFGGSEDAVYLGRS